MCHVCEELQLHGRKACPDDKFSLDRSCKYINYSKFGDRLASYGLWPRALSQKPLDLAKAGFFYQGIGDHVICFYCGGALKNWDNNDQPFNEHARWFSNCKYVMHVRGRDFVQSQNPSKLIEANLSEDEEMMDISTKARDDLEHEIALIQSKRLCIKCRKYPQTVLLMPCSHLAVCTACSRSCLNAPCPVPGCNHDVTGVIKVFL